MFCSFQCLFLKNSLRCISKYLHLWNNAASGIQWWFGCWQISPLTIVFTPRKETSKLLSLCPYHCDHSSHGPTEQDLEWLGKETEWHLQIMSFYPPIIILSTLTIKNLFSGACSLVGVHSEHKYIYNLCLFKEILPHTSLPNLLFASVLILFLLTPWPSTLMKDP